MTATEFHAVLNSCGLGWPPGSGDQWGGGNFRAIFLKTPSSTSVAPLRSPWHTVHWGLSDSTVFEKPEDFVVQKIK